MPRRSSCVFLAVFFAVVLCLGLGGCKDQSVAANEAVEAVMAGYTVQSADENSDDADSKKDQVELVAPNYGDEATASILGSLDVNMDDFHTHAFSRYSYEVGEVTMADDKKSAQVEVTITNVSLLGAANNAAADFATYAESDEYQTAFAEGGRTPLFAKLVEYLYQHLDSDELVTSTVTVTVTKDDSGNWSYDPSNDAAFYSALYGGSNVLGGLANALQ